MLKAPPMFDPGPVVSAPAPAPVIAPPPPGLPPKADLDLTIEIMCQMMEVKTLFDLAALKQRHATEIARLSRHPKTAREFAEVEAHMRNLITRGRI